MKRLFLPFHNLSPNDMHDNAVVRAHALKVMATVEKAVARLDETENLIKILHDLGRRHFTYNAKFFIHQCVLSISTKFFVTRINT